MAFIDIKKDIGGRIKEMCQDSKSRGRVGRERSGLRPKSVMSPLFVIMAMTDVMQRMADNMIGVVMKDICRSRFQVILKIE